METNVSGKTRKNKADESILISEADEEVGQQEDEYREQVIIPRVVLPDFGDPQVKAILEEAEDEHDMHQHFFADQVQWDRPMWNKWWFSKAAMICFAVDMSCINGFPQSVANNGGFIFLIAYVFSLAVLGLPILYLEVIVGQYFQTGMLGIWGVCPIFKGISYGLFVVLYVLVFYIPSNVLWASIMMIQSFGSLRSGSLPWAHCNNDWNTCRCRGIRNEECKGINITGQTMLSPADEYFLAMVLKIWKSKHVDPNNIRSIAQNGNWTEAYGFSNQIEGLGPLLFTSGVILLSIYILSVMCIFGNIKYSGYVYTIGSGLPLLTFTLLSLRGVTLEGAVPGLVKYFKPNFVKLFDWQLWYKASSAAFNSLGCGFGCHISIASYSPLHQNVYMDAVVCVVIDTLTSLLATIVAFSFVSHDYKLHHEDLPDEFPDADFAFIVFADSIAPTAAASFFAGVFYFTVALFTFDTTTVSLQAVTFSLYEEYRRKFPDQAISKQLFSFSLVSFAFFVSLLCITRGGYWVYKFIEVTSFGFSVILVIWLQVITLTWLWGTEEICVAVECITSKRPSLFMRICWKFVAPIMTTAFLINGILEVSAEPFTILESNLYTAGEVFYVSVGFQVIPLMALIIYAILSYRKIRKISKSSTETAMLLISPEYEHDSIHADIKSAKRLHCKHYKFLKDPNTEEDNVPIKVKITRIVQSIKEVIPKCRSRVKPANSSRTPGGKLKTKKVDSAWDLYQKMKNSESLNDQTKQPEPEKSPSKEIPVKIDTSSKHTMSSKGMSEESSIELGSKDAEKQALKKLQNKKKKTKRQANLES